MKVPAISSITAIFAIILVGFVTCNAKNLEVTTNFRPWLEEEEFSLDTSLHATLDQVIIFDLEPADTWDKPKKRYKKDQDKYHRDHEENRDKYKKYRSYRGKSDKDYEKYETEYEKNDDEYRKGYEDNHDKYHSKKSKGNGRHKKQKLYLGDHELKWNSIRFVVPETIDVSFCLPEDEPFIAALEMETVDGDRVLWSRPGDACEVIKLEADRYLLHVFHDPKIIEEPGRKVFFHRPGQARLLGNADSSFVVLNFMAFKAPDGRFVTSATTSPLFPLEATEATVGPNEVWRLGSSSPYTFTDGKGSIVKFSLVEVPYFAGSQFSAQTAPFKIIDEGAGQFHLTLFVGNASNNLKAFADLDSNNRLIVDSLAKAIFTVDYKGFDCTTCDESALSLQEGEVALFAGCNYTGPAIVFGSDVADLSIYDVAAALGLGMGNNMAASIRLGPNTFARLYPDSQFSGNSIGVGGDIPCLDTTSLGKGILSSFQVIADFRQYIIASDACENCYLSGVDLSGLDFTAGIFTGTNFTGANLTNTVFRSARLDHADFFGNTTILTGTVFFDAILFCSDLSGSNLSTAIFDNDPIITKDFSCRLNLSGATLPVNAIPFASWRYTNFTGADLQNGAGTTISTTAAPVDLSGALLSGVTGLSGVFLDGADLGCATPTETDKKCTQLIDTDLSNTSLIQASLAGAALNGANLIQANLEMADLSGAQLLKSPDTLDSAKLEGAYLKDANLALADLSGATLTNANWYSSNAVVCSGSTWTGTCASGEGATLSNADLTGAYLNGLDLSNATLQGANLAGALLVGANFTSANLSRDPTTGASTNFSGAFLQGADFTDAIPTGADFLSGYVDQTTTTDGSIAFQLPVDNLKFIGYWKDPVDLECVFFSYSQPTEVPMTDIASICPDASNGPCTYAKWQSPSTPISEAQPPSSSNFPTVAAGACTAFSDIDFTW